MQRSCNGDSLKMEREKTENGNVCSLLDETFNFTDCTISHTCVFPSFIERLVLGFRDLSGTQAIHCQSSAAVSLPASLLCPHAVLLPPLATKQSSFLPRVVVLPPLTITAAGQKRGGGLLAHGGRTTAQGKGGRLAWQARSAWRKEAGWLGHGGRTAWFTDRQQRLAQ